ncbi:unnamed protein product, partial [Mesorhabditis belari]|uniref:C-type lectin domain-containing protein n=1 Tax=Mesorhabditis belari TaxID=2138241 RepID=A0AAF3FQW1_9BILA
MGQNDSWAWSDGSTFDYQRFQASNDTGDCLVMSAVDGTWKRDNCAADKYKTYYCVSRPMPSLSPPLPTQPSSLNCSSPQFQPLYNCLKGWQYFPETGYQYLVIYNVSFDDGEAYCQSLGAHLVSIHSEAENTFVTRLCCPSSEAYHYEAAAAMYLTGGHRRTFDWGPFTWTDGSANDYAGLSCTNEYGPANLVVCRE